MRAPSNRGEGKHKKSKMSRRFDSGGLEREYPMKYFIQLNATAKHGYDLVKVDEKGKETIVSLDKKTADDYLYLPDDVVKATNRKLIGINAIKKSGATRYELTVKEYREPRVLGPRTESGPRKKLEDYLTDDEKATIAAIMEKAKERREADKPVPLTPLEKARREYERKKAAYEKLMSEAEA